MLTDFNDNYVVEMYLSLFATNWYIPFVRPIWYNTCVDIMITETEKFF